MGYSLAPYPLAHLRELASKWREQPFLEEYRWIKDRNRPQPDGESKGFYVHSPGLRYTGYLKPGLHRSALQPAAAYEKIASDLAYDLNLHFRTNLAVPPVQLYRRPDVEEFDEQLAHTTCVSLVPYPEILTMTDAERLRSLGALSEQRLSNIRQGLRNASGMLAFHTFIGQFDANYIGNTVYGETEDMSANEVFFIDHAWSLNYNGRWSQGYDWRTVQPSPVPPWWSKHLNLNLISTTAEAISRFNPNHIESIVKAIPGDFMAHADQEVVVKALRHRQQRIVPAMDRLCQMISSIRSLAQ